MDEFWKWMMRANAKAVFCGALVGLLATSGWWIYKEYMPDTTDTPAVVRDGSADVSGPELELVAFLDRRLSADTENLPPNPFFPEPKPRPKPQPSPKPEPDDDAGPDPKPPRRKPGPGPDKPDAADDDAGQQPPKRPPRRKPPRPDPPEKKPEKKPERVALTYRGMFERTDGVIMALIHDSKTKATRFYSMEDDLFGMKVEGLKEREAEIRDVDGSSVVLDLGEAVNFEDGRFVD